MIGLLGRLAPWIAGYAAVATAGLVLSLGMYVGAREDVAQEREQCNTRVAEGARAATDALRQAQIDSYEARIAQLEEIALRESSARAIAEEAARAAEGRPERVRTVIREVASANKCLDTAVPAAVLDSLHD